MTIKTFLTTGYYPSLTGGQFIILQSLEPVGIPTKFKILPEYLKDLGYATHGLGKWHLGFCHPDYLPHNRGFDSWSGLWNGGGYHYMHNLPAVRGDNDTIGFDYFKNEELDYSSLGKSTSQLIADHAQEILSKHVAKNTLENTYNASNPFFMYAAFQDAHSPLQVEEEFTDLYPNEEDLIRKKYLGMVSRLDAAVGRIVDNLQSITYTDTEDGETRSMLEDTIIIFSSDNGGQSLESFLYEGGSNLPLRGLKESFVYILLSPFVGHNPRLTTL